MRHEMWSRILSFLGAEYGIILGDQSGFAPTKLLTSMPDIGGYPVPLNPGGEDVYPGVRDFGR